MGCASSNSVRDVEYDGKKDNALVEGHLSSAFRQNLVAENKRTKIDLDYTIDWNDQNALGSGATSTVRKIQHMVTGKTYALKTIQLNRLSAAMRESLLNEVKIMKQLDHPNIIKIFETYIDFQRLYIVMECCTGGELFDKLYDQPQSKFLEPMVKGLATKMVSSLKYLHDNNVFHRDLKLENFIFTKPGDQGEIKLIDFGLSTAYLEGQKFDSKVGTSYYMAPEVINSNVAYTESADMWSFGCVVFMLLSGVVPFGGRTDDEIMEKAQKGEFYFRPMKWSGVSEEAKHFVTKLLTKDPEKRMSATDALKHPFLLGASLAEIDARGVCSDAPAGEDKEIALSNESLKNLKKFRDYGALKKATLLAITMSLDEDEIASLRETFQRVDKENNGVITLKEFSIVMAEHGITEKDQCKAMFDSIDQDHSAVIKYSEFLAACVEEKYFLDDKRVIEAFNRLDEDHSGSITMANLKKLLGDQVSDDSLARMFKEVDIDESGTISLKEFREMLMK
jgi:calcium-dependent protein kinase